MPKDMFGLRMPKTRGLGLGGFVEPKKRKRTLGVTDRNILYKRAKGRCEVCNKKIVQSDMQVGHKKAYSKGGATTLANSACLCYGCNKDQGTGSLETLKKKRNGTYGKKTKKKNTSSKRKVKKNSNPFGTTFKPVKMGGWRF